MRAIRILPVIVGVIAAVMGFSSYMSRPSDNDGVLQSSDQAAQTGQVVSTEEQVHELFLSLETEDQEGFNKILDLLPDIDWAVYSEKYRAIGDDSPGAMDLMKWLTNAPWTQQGSNMLKVFQARKGLDGDLKDQYSVIAGTFFRSRREEFVKLLGRLDRQDIEQVCRLVAYNSYYNADISQLKDATLAYFKDMHLPDNERFVVDSLVTAFDGYITDDSP